MLRKIMSKVQKNPYTENDNRLADVIAAAENQG